MSLSRLALRLAAVEMLCPSALAPTGPYPTWAGAEVYDSRISTISDVTEWQNFLAQIEGKPLVMVYTEEQDTTPVSGEYPAGVEMVDLVIETMIVAQGMVEVEGPDGLPMQIGSIETPITSAQHEATLDMLEAQIRALIDPASPQHPDATVSVARATYLRIARELHHVKSAPVRDTDKVSKHAARTITFKLRIPQAQAYAAPDMSVAADIRNLPAPLSWVAQALDKDSAGGQLVRQIAAGQPPAATLTNLRDIRIASSLDRGAAPTAETADLTSDVAL